MPKAPQPAGTIRVMRRFPVKGMAGEKLGEVFVSYAGLVGDRVYAYFDPQNKTDFPWMTPEGEATEGISDTARTIDCGK